MKPVLIAETDEFGQVGHVWEWRRRRNTLRPVAQSRAGELNIAEFETSGAPREQIAEWISRHAK